MIKTLASLRNACELTRELADVLACTFALCPENYARDLTRNADRTYLCMTGDESTWKGCVVLDESDGEDDIILDGVLYLCDVYVKPGYRNDGVAKSLVKHAIMAVKTSMPNIKEIRLHCVDMTISHFYASNFGFEVVDTPSHSSRDNPPTMRLSFNDVYHLPV